ncbi:D-alanyl-D-alanine carboxypeptidase (penicillin-binding protein 5/6) [Hoeflea marina]|uniref:serine-type D-Ala-D-Ala carboxypeptidase n=1 Tax=Hoeflea marina TaxID=274592 RepID=A0A317PQR8_9HYPH|nr:D-alanyl-D-alanine carboxypeptidase family protein [Hoeflea marina]PWW03831.1 D-alanyl-D-alanine carboxypeptidase (penicillin-binding protein 5/6) [Hoeflea marina]
MPRRLSRFLIALLAAVLVAAPAARAQLFETKATEAYLIEADTGTVLFAKNENRPVPPASLAKLMTMEVVFNAIKSGRLTLDDQFVVSENAWRTGGAPSRTSTMFAELKSSIRLEDLIRGVVVQQANDGCIIIAEGMAGSEENFAREMTERAKLLGLSGSVFANATGLPESVSPEPVSKVTMRDLVTLARHMQATYPDFYRYYAEAEFSWNKILQRNRNPLLAMDIGAEGLATGYAEESGYAIVASVNREGRRLFLAMSGLDSERARAEEARRILDWGLRAFEKKPLYADGEIVGQASVYGGDPSSVPLKAAGPVEIFLPITSPEKLTARITYRWPLKPPVAEGDQLGTLKIWIGDNLSREEPLYAAAAATRGPLHRRALDALVELVQFWH